MKNYVSAAAIVLFCLAISFTLTGCDGTSGSALSIHPRVLPEELADCRFYQVDPGGMHPYLYITRCPNSTTSTTYRQGKVTRHTLVVETPEEEPVKPEEGSCK